MILIQLIKNECFETVEHTRKKETLQLLSPTQRDQM